MRERPLSTRRRCRDRCRFPPGTKRNQGRSPASNRSWKSASHSIVSRIMVKPLPRSFYDRPTLQVARELLGCLLHRRLGDRLIVGRVVETEAYVGTEDRACHASKGLTPRTEVMFGPPGHAYVYLIYGLHHCLNTVTEGQGSGSAVLIRALEPVSGLASQPKPRLQQPGARTDGPARLTQALQIDRGLNRWDLTQGQELWLEGADRPQGPIATGPRIGVDYAGEWAARPWRFWLEGNPWVSVGPRRKRAPVIEAPDAAQPGKDRADGP